MPADASIEEFETSSSIVEDKNCSVYIISAGVDRYQSSEFLKLEGCALDCVDVSAAIVKVSRSHFTQVINKTFVDEQATTNSIKDAFAEVGKVAKPRDIFIFHFSGHGIRSKDGYQLGFHDSNGFDSTERNGQSSSTAQPMVSCAQIGEWSSKIRAERQLFILDSSDSADAIPSLAHSAAQSVVFGIQGDEGTFSGHGIFSGTLLEGLKGKADLDGNGIITVRELRDFAAASLGECRNDQFHSANSPRVIVSSVRNNFAIGAIAGSLRDAIPCALKDEPSINLSPSSNTALLIATDKYSDGNFQALKNPISDSRALAKELASSFGFKVETMENPTRREILERVKKLSVAKYASGDQLFVFIAGHGLWDSDEKEGYLVTQDSRADDSLHDSYIPLSELRTKIDHLNCKHILLGLDICYGGTLVEDIALGLHQLRSGIMSVRPLSEILVECENLPSRKFIAAGGKKPVFDGLNHSPLVDRMLELLRSKGGSKQYICFSDIESSIKQVQPQGLARTFGIDDPGSDFILIPISAIKEGASAKTSVYAVDRYKTVTVRKTR